MKRATLAIAAAAAAAALLGSAALLTAGPLNPPPGAPTPTYKTLQEVEPRIPISTALTVITQPGSYYLTNNLTQPLAPGVTCILIATSNVTIDLNGFTLTGGQTAIEIAGNATTNVTIRNGVIRSTSGSGIFASGAPRATAVTVSNVRMDSIADAAVIVGDRAVIDNVHVVGAPGSTTSSGINVGANSRVTNSSSQSVHVVGFQVGPGSLIEASLAANNTGTSPNGNGFILGTGAQAERCVARSNAGDGFFLESGAVALDCTATSNTGAGFRIASNVRLDRCTADANFNAGIAALGGTTHQVIERSSISGSTIGIRAFGANRITIRHNTLRGVSPTAGAGIALGAGDDDAVITHNSFAFMLRAVETNAGFAIITNNTLNFTTGFGTSTSGQPAPNNFVGPLIQPNTAATATNPFANIIQ